MASEVQIGIDMLLCFSWTNLLLVIESSFDLVIVKVSNPVARLTVKELSKSINYDFSS